MPHPPSATLTTPTICRLRLPFTHGFSIPKVKRQPCGPILETPSVHSELPNMEQNLRKLTITENSSTSSAHTYHLSLLCARLENTSIICRYYSLASLASRISHASHNLRLTSHSELPRQFTETCQFENEHRASNGTLACSFQSLRSFSQPIPFS